MSDAANPAAHNTDALEDAADELDRIASAMSFGYPRTASGYAELCDELLAIASSLRAALSAAPPNDPLGRLATWADENDAALTIERDPRAPNMDGDKWDATVWPPDDEAVGCHGATLSDVVTYLLAALAGAPEGDDDA